MAAFLIRLAVVVSHPTTFTLILNVSSLLTDFLPLGSFYFNPPSIEIRNSLKQESDQVAPYLYLRLWNTEYDVHTPNSHYNLVSSSFPAPSSLHKSWDPVTLNNSLFPELSFSFLPRFSDAIFFAWNTIPNALCLANSCLSCSKSPLQNLPSPPNSDVTLVCVPIAIYLYSSRSCLVSLHWDCWLSSTSPPACELWQSRALTYKAQCQRLLTQVKGWPKWVLINVGRIEKANIEGRVMTKTKALHSDQSGFWSMCRHLLAVWNLRHSIHFTALSLTYSLLKSW